MRPANESQPNETPSVQTPVRPGDVVSGKYRIEGQIGVGGMGAVFAATHLELEKRVALKFLTLKMTDNSEVQQRFKREARAAAKIQSEHVGQVSDVGELTSGVPFIVMEYLEGKDLLDILEADGPLPVERAVTYVLQACEAIAEAHAAGIVHRDLKPANLFLARRAGGPAIVKVLDFGISKMGASHNAPGDGAITRASRVSMTRRSVSGADPGLTAPTSMLGSPLYMSPEQLSSAHQVDARTDIWSLGIILWELVTANVPFNEATMPLIYVAILEKPAPLLREVLPTAPAALEAVIARCLSKDPANRYRDVIELIDALAPLAPKQGEISAARVSSLSRVPERDPPIVTGKTVLRDAPTISAWGQNKARPTGRKRMPLVIGASVVVLAVAAFGVRSWVRGDATTVTQAAPLETNTPEPLVKSADPVDPAPPSTASPTASAEAVAPEPSSTTAHAAGTGAPSVAPIVTPTPSTASPATPPTTNPRSTPAGQPVGLATTKVSRTPKGATSAAPQPTGAPPNKGTTGFGDRE